MLALRQGKSGICGLCKTLLKQSHAQCSQGDTWVAPLSPGDQQPQFDSESKPSEWEPFTSAVAALVRTLKN